MSLEEIGEHGFAHAHSRCSPWKEAVVFEGSVVLLMLVSELHIELDQLEGEATFMPVATLESFIFYVLKFTIFLCAVHDLEELMLDTD